MVEISPRGKLALGAAVALATFPVGGLANAQTMNANSASYNAGYGRYAGEENQPVDVNMHDANGNVTAVDGIIQAGDDQSIFAHTVAGGVFDTVSGVSTSTSVTVVSKSIVVVTQSDGHDHSDHTNNGNVSASPTLSGGVSNDH